MIVDVQEKIEQAIIRKQVSRAVEAISQLLEARHVSFMDNVAKLIADTFLQGGKVIIAGNGGSLCDASHFAEELTGFFDKKRRALPCIVLSEPGHLTCTANDIGYEWVFHRGLEAHGKVNDVFIGLTTSGNSISILRAFEKAKELQMHTVAFLGKGGGKTKGIADFEMLIDGFTRSDRVQEAHMCALHIIIEIIERHLFGE